jgi:hypothetical protein
MLVADRTTIVCLYTDFRNLDGGIGEKCTSDGGTDENFSK